MAFNLSTIKLPPFLQFLHRIHIGPRTRKVLKYVGLVVFAIIVFVFALQMSFPYARVKDKVIESMADKYDVTIGSVERGIMPGRVYFKAVSIRTRQTKPDETVTTFYIKELQLDVGIFAAIGGSIALDLEAEIGAGTLSGSVRVEKFGKGNISAEFEGESLPGANLPLRAVLGLPMTGKLEFDVDLFLPMEKSKMGRTAINWQKAAGTISLGCPSGCTIGDGTTKLKPLLKNTRQQAMVQEGIDFGKVTMDALTAKVTIKKGKLTLDKFDAKSRDGEVKIDYMMTLEKEFSESMVAGCLRFKGSDDLLTREPRTHAALSTTGAERRADGFFHIRLTDRFKDMKRLNAECGPGTQINNAENFGRNERPNLTVQPDQPGSAMTAPPPPAIPMSDAGVATMHDAGAGSAAPGSAAAPGAAAPGAAAPGAAAPGTTAPAMQNEGGPPGKLPANLTGSAEQPANPTPPPEEQPTHR